MNDRDKDLREVHKCVSAMMIGAGIVSLLVIPIVLAIVVSPWWLITYAPIAGAGIGAGVYFDVFDMFY